MEKQVKNIFECAYCAKCFEPIAGECRGNCPACGELLVPINLFDRIKRDKDIAKKSFLAFLIGIILLLLSILVHLVYSVAAIVTCFNGTPASPVPSVGDLYPLWYYGVIASSASAVLTLIVIVIIVAELLDKKPHGLSIIYGVSGGLSCLMFFSMNFLSTGLLFAGIAVIGIMETKVRSKALKKSRLKHLDKLRFEIIDSKEWRCNNCGYINIKKDSQCKSCGKYK